MGVLAEVSSNAEVAGAEPARPAQHRLAAHSAQQLLAARIAQYVIAASLAQHHLLDASLLAALHAPRPRVGAVCAGIIAGLVGVGGGMLLGPLMLQIGVLPQASSPDLRKISAGSPLIAPWSPLTSASLRVRRQVSAATTGTMILLTSSSASALFLAAGHSPLDYALAFGLVTTVGAYLGKRVVSLLVRRFQCASLIVLVLGGLITASVAAIGTAGALDLLEKLEAGELLSSLVLRFPCVGP